MVDLQNPAGDAASNAINQLAGDLQENIAELKSLKKAVSHGGL